MSMLNKLTEGIRQRSLSREGEAITSKWEQTGLLEGLEDDNARSSMARLLENQAAQLLKENSTMEGGDVEGFASVAFPIVRRVFGGLLAQELVSVQPMSLPSGLIFFMDFTYTSTASLAGAVQNESVYGGGRVAGQITGGVDLKGVALAADNASAPSDKGFRNLGGGYAAALATVDNVDCTLVSDATTKTFSAESDANRSLIKHDPDIAAGNHGFRIVKTDVAATTKLPGLNINQLAAIQVEGATNNSLIGNAGTEIDDEDLLVRRLTFIDADGMLNLVFSSRTIGELGTGALSDDKLKIHYPVADAWKGGTGTGSVMADASAKGWPLEDEAGNEIDIKVDSVAVTAITKKLKATWTPELAQDLNAYHNLDAEVELTSVLSEMIALELDQEILRDLVEDASAATYYWSRRPGKFLNRDTGAPVEDWSANGIDSSANLLGGDFTGTVSEWYETLLETINDVSAQIHRKTLRGGANFIVCSPEVASILEMTSGFRASVDHDGDKGSWGAVKQGSISNKMEIYVDPNFLRQVVLVGRKGSSFLESGYVYAPYVPLQMTPTVLAADDFTPRKGVMTRYAKKMVRPDMYGLVVCADLLG